MKKKILVVIARLNSGGTAKYLYQLHRSLKNSEYEIQVATGFVEGEETEDSLTAKMPLIRISNLRRSLSLVDDFKARKQILSCVATYQPDLIYTHTFKAGLLVRTMKLDLPIVHAHHGHSLNNPEFNSFAKLLWIFIEKYLSKKCAFLVTVGANVAEELLQKGIGKRSQYISIPPGVTELKKVPKGIAKKSLKLPRIQEPIVLWLGRFEEVKNPMLVVEITKLLPSVSFVMGGHGLLFNKISTFRLPNLHLVGWQDSATLFSLSDIVINTSLSEGMSLAIIEAQLLGIPVVATDVGSTGEIIEHGVSGYLSDKSAESFSYFIMKILSNKTISKSMKKQARLRAKSNFSVGNFRSKHIELFSKVI